MEGKVKFKPTVRNITFNKWIFLVIVSWTCFYSRVQAVETQSIYSDDEITATVVEPGVTVIETYDNTTMYVVEGDSLALLIDTGTKCSDLSKKIFHLIKKPFKVVLTHGHFDHAGNIGFFPEIYMHNADKTLETNQLKNYKGEILTVSEGDIFDLGNRKIEVIHTPGHTPGSISLIDEKAGIAFTGDSFGSGQLWMQLNPQLSFAELSESIGKMIELMNEKKINKLYVGHYPYQKRPLGIDYLLDLEIACRKIDKGDIAESVPFGDKALLLKQGEAEIVFLPENSNKRSIPIPYVLLKFDDVHYGDGNEAVPPRWNKVLNYLNEKNIKANFGIIGYSLVKERPDYLMWIKDVSKRDNIEFWNHGYYNRMSLDEPGEFEQDYETQYKALHLTDSLALNNAGIKLQAWGRHWTEYNEHTDRALSTVDGLNLIFGDPENPVHFKGLVIPFNLEMEYPFHNPVYRTFLINYFGKWRHLNSFYLQGHPNSWDEVRWAELEKIINRLEEDKVKFISISDYIDLRNKHIIEE